MPQAVPALIVAAGQAIANVAVAKIIFAFVVNVSLTGFEFNEGGERWVALKRS